MNLLNFFIKRFMRGILVLIGLSIFSFMMVSFSPIDPVQAYLGGSYATKEQEAKIRDYWELDKPLATRYISWGKKFLSGDLGESKIELRPVKDVLKDRWKTSMALLGFAWVFSSILGYFLGIWAGITRGKIPDKIIKWYSYTLASMPLFWLALMFLLFFSVWLKIFPIALSVPIGVLKEDVAFMDRLKHFILPALTLSLLGLGNVALHTREKVIDVMNSEYVLFAKARGEKTFEILKNHIIRNTLIPVLALCLSHFGELFGGSILAERVFSYPGLGSIITMAGLKGDTALLLGVVMISALFVITGNFLADLISMYINPELKNQK